jgi:hypothetical protein
MSEHTRKPPTSRRCGSTPWTPACVCLIGLLVAGCAHGVRLSDADRAQLNSAPRIHVLPYETPLPRLKLAGERAPPTPTEIRRHAAADPATLVARSFAFLLGKKERLKNLRLETHRPPPRVKSAADYSKDHWRGLALDLWVEDWTFEELAGEPDRFNMRLTARARLARIDDGRVLWSTGRCSLGGNGQELHLSKAELTRGTRLRKLLTYTREECARQLIRDFSVAEEQR